MFRGQKMQHFFSLGILLYRQSKRWRCLAQEEADVGKLCARRNMGVWQWGASTRWQQAMDQDVSWVEPSQANKGIKALPVCFERSFSIFFRYKTLDDGEVRRGRLHGRISAAMFFSRLSHVHLTEQFHSCLNPDVDTGDVLWWTWPKACLSLFHSIFIWITTLRAGLRALPEHSVQTGGISSACLWAEPEQQIYNSGALNTVTFTMSWILWNDLPRQSFDLLKAVAFDMLCTCTTLSSLRVLLF